MKKSLEIIKNFSQLNEQDTLKYTVFTKEFKEGYSAAMNDIRWACNMEIKNLAWSGSMQYFEANYIEASGITRAMYDEHFTTLPCACDEEGCEGWACVSNTESAIKAHMKFYAPKEEK